ncbi:MAG: hypothetical protein KGJ73_06355 [Rhodospirillales bacterium]|nr:hypothetical protein [Rhodospirillales bacterium]
MQDKALKQEIDNGPDDDGRDDDRHSHQSEPCGMEQNSHGATATRPQFDA